MTSIKIRITTGIVTATITIVLSVRVDGVAVEDGVEGDVSEATSVVEAREKEE